jgi:hypothetical protein
LRLLKNNSATAPVDAMSRDQLIALIQRMEAVFLMSIGQGSRPTATAFSMASILDCRARPSPAGTPQVATSRARGLRPWSFEYCSLANRMAAA